MPIINPTRSDSLIEVNKKGVSNREKAGTNLVHRWFQDGWEALELGCIATESEGNLVLALGNTQQYSRQKYMPLRHVQLKI
jgi:hypothetical protein